MIKSHSTRNGNRSEVFQVITVSLKMCLEVMTSKSDRDGNDRRKSNINGSSAQKIGTNMEE